MRKRHEERQLFKRYHEQGDVAARDEVIRRSLPLARGLASRYARPGQPVEDLVQVASLGLVKAVDRYDPERGPAFSSYAAPTIIGELKRYFRDFGWAVHVPRGLQERAMRVNHATLKLSRETGRSPTVSEVAAEIGESPEQVLEAMEAAIAYSAVSIYAPRSGGEDEGDTYADAIGMIDERFELMEFQSAIGPTMRALPERDRLVLKLRFEEDLTQSEIAKRIGISQMHVSRLIRRSLERLRSVAEAQ